DTRARDILVPGCASLTRATQVHRDRWRLQNPNPSPRLSQRERGIEGRSPDKAEGRIRGNWAPITDARARDILVPGCASLTRATQVHRDRWRLQNPNPSPRLSQRERGIEGVARIRPKAASGGWAPPRMRVRATSS